MSPRLGVLYDGWLLVQQPNSPTALHLLALLRSLPEEIQPTIALPGPPPPWLGEISYQVQATPATAWGHLKWEQRHLSQMARRKDARLLHLTDLHAPLFRDIPCVVSPSGFSDLGSPEAHLASDETRGFTERLSASLGQGGLARTSAIFWPDDLPKPSNPAPLIVLPPLVPPDFFASKKTDPIEKSNGSNQVTQEIKKLNLPETYILYHGPGDSRSLQTTLNAWSWAAGSISDYHPLIFLGLDEAARRRLDALAEVYKLRNSLRALPTISPKAVAAVYHGSSALFHPLPISLWGEPLRLALASEKPVVATETPLTDALVGAAAYLAPVQDGRALGAALITVIVEEEVGERLSAAARQRSAAWQKTNFGSALYQAYLTLLG